MFRYGRPFSPDQITRELRRIRSVPANHPERNFDCMTEAKGWATERASWDLGWEVPGPPEPDGIFERACRAVERYEFSDPEIVCGHFDPDEPLRGRTMLLELKALGVRVLSGVRVTDVDRREDDRLTCWGFRYDTLQGHVERGAEWFRVTKDHRTGEVCFFIESRWRWGELPAWWLRRGVPALAPYYRNLWMQRAAVRLRALTRDDPPLDLSPAQRWGTVAGLGALTGLRTMAGPAVAAQILMHTGVGVDAGPAERWWTNPVTAVCTGVSAVAESIADKHPRIPSRLEVPPLAARVASAGFAAVLVTRSWRRPALLSALVAVGSALGTAGVVTRLRRYASTKLGVPSAAFGLLEDVAILFGGRWLTKRSLSGMPDLLEFDPGPDLR